MDPRDLVKGLLDLRGIRPASFLRANGLEAFQPTFSKWLNGKTSNPRRHWLAPVAKALGIKAAALSDETIAAEEASRLGLGSTLAVAERSPPAYFQRPRQSRIDPAVLAIQIGDLMRGYDQDLREAAAPLFRMAAAQPDRAGEAATKLRQLLETDPDQAKRSGTNG